MHHLSIDLETYSSVPIAKAGAQKYISSPDFEILLFAYSVDGAPVEIIDLARGERLPPWLVQAITSPEYIKHAYNAPFEWGCLSKFLGTLPPDQWRCTMFHGLYCGYTAGLDATGKALGLAEDKRKLNTGKALIRYFCVPCAPTKANGGRTRNLPQHDTDKWELFKEYCRQDVVTEMEIERRLSAFPVPDFVQKQWETDLIIYARGVAVDMDLVSGALYLGNVTRQNLTQEAMKISKLDNPNSVAQLTQWLQEAMGEELADLRKDTVARLLGKEDNSPQVQRMLEIRQELGKTSTKKYDAKLAVKQGDPEAKNGVVGAFCRTYDIYRAMDELIPGMYEPVESMPGRYTYLGGSTTGGAVIYDSGKFLYSHHATDPCSGKLVNAFDLVRLHRFGDKDDEAQPGTPTNRLPSYSATASN